MIWYHTLLGWDIHFLKNGKENTFYDDKTAYQQNPKSLR